MFKKLQIIIKCELKKKISHVKGLISRCWYWRFLDTKIFYDKNSLIQSLSIMNHIYHSYLSSINNICDSCMAKFYLRSHFLCIFLKPEDLRSLLTPRLIPTTGLGLMPLLIPTNFHSY